MFHGREQTVEDLNNIVEILDQRRYEIWTADDDEGGRLPITHGIRRCWSYALLTLLKSFAVGARLLI